MINIHIIYSSIVVLSTLLITLIAWPLLDIELSKLFYTETHGFIYRNNYLVLLFFKLIPILTKLFIFICISYYLFYKLLKYNKTSRILSTLSLYLIISALIGPGLIVNYIFKENFGRARPKEISYFNGKKSFTPAASISDQCTHNCSFSSGHAAMAYYFTALGYVFVLRNNIYNNSKTKPYILTSKYISEKKTFTLIYIICLVFGSLVGFSRVLMGGHFVSDVIASCCVVLMTNHLLYLFWSKKVIPKLLL